MASLRNGCAFNAEALRTPSHTPSAQLPAETHHIPRAQRPVERLRDRIELRRLHEWLPANEFGVLRFCGAVRHLRFQPRSGFSQHLWDGAWRGRCRSAPIGQRCNACRPTELTAFLVSNEYCCSANNDLEES